MESLTRLVSESLARHGFDRPLDYRRLHWSRWFRCESPHSLLFVPSKPGVFALAEEVYGGTDAVYGGTDAPVRPAGQSPASSSAEALAPALKRMLAVAQFFEDDDMAFVLDRMLSHQNPMRSRLLSGRYFVRFVTIEDESQRRSICSALNQWISSASEKVTGIGSHFASSLELTPATEYVRGTRETPSPSPARADTTDAQVGQSLLSANPDIVTKLKEATKVATPSAPGAASPHLNSGAATNMHCPPAFPSGF